MGESFTTNVNCGGIASGTEIHSTDPLQTIIKNMVYGSGGGGSVITGTFNVSSYDVSRHSESDWVNKSTIICLNKEANFRTHDRESVFCLICKNGNVCCSYTVTNMATDGEFIKGSYDSSTGTITLTDSYFWRSYSYYAW